MNGRLDRYPQIRVQYGKRGWEFLKSRYLLATPLKTSLENYTRLARDLFGMSSLWRGPDHLVYVKGSGFLLPFTEEYKRFHYSEIQAFSLVQTSRLGLAILFVILIVAFGGIAALFLGLPEEITFAISVTASVFLLGAMASTALLIRHLVLGPTCQCDVQTAISKERLRPLSRLHQTKHAIEMMEGAIGASQRELGQKSQGEEQASHGAVQGGNEFYSIGKPIVITFYLFVGLAVAALVGLHIVSLAVTGCILALLFAGALLVILSLVASVRKLTPEPIRVALWGLLGTLFVFVGCGAVYFLVAATQNPEYTIGLAGPLQAYAEIDRNDGVVVYSIFLGLSLFFLLWSFLGLGESMRWSRRINRANTISSDNE